MRGNIGNLLKQAQAVQQNIQKAQEQVAQITATGESGGGMVKVTMNGKHEVARVQIEPTLMSEEREVLEDLITAAINDATHKVGVAVNEKMAGAMAGMQLPPGMKLPFSGLTEARPMKHPVALERLIEALHGLPGIGPKTAQRLAFRLLQDGRGEARELAQALEGALIAVGRCRRCRMLAEGELCLLCKSTARDDALLCVVESPADVIAVENSGAYQGRYFVLMGHLSPLDGIGPAELGLHELDLLLAEGLVREVILATNSTVEGEATAHVVSEMARVRGLRATRIAQGVPFGGELEYVDGSTLSAALAGRQSAG